MQKKRSTFLFSVLCFGLAFLYLPMIVMIIYSFNYSKIVPVWGGFSTRWYAKLFESEQIWNALTLSLKIAVVNATFATILGTLAGLALVRFGHFKGRTIFGGMITAPLVMPEVITGLSLLMLFITLKEFIGWPDKRGFTTITIAHITFSMAYVAVIIPPNIVRPLKCPNRTSANPASVPNIVAKVAFTTAILRLSVNAFQICSLSNNFAYQRVENPPQTGTIFE